MYKLVLYKSYQHPVSNCKVRKFLRMHVLINHKKRLKESYEKYANYFGTFKTKDNRTEFSNFQKKLFYFFQRLLVSYQQIVDSFSNIENEVQKWYKLLCTKKAKKLLLALQCIENM